jgi:hypothetical protein
MNNDLSQKLFCIWGERRGFLSLLFWRGQLDHHENERQAGCHPKLHNTLEHCDKLGLEKAKSG